jgi:hypothetical protein
MLDAAGDDQQLALADGDGAVAELHRERAVEDEEELVFGLVAVPDERPLQLHQLHVLAVQLADDLRVPVGAEPGEAFLQIDDVHGGFPRG